jgi:hypothetical protein
LWKDKSEDGVRKILEDNIIPLDRLLVNICVNVKKS